MQVHLFLISSDYIYLIGSFECVNCVAQQAGWDLPGESGGGVESHIFPLDKKFASGRAYGVCYLL